MDVEARLADLRTRAAAALANAGSTAELEQWRVHFLGKRGALTEVLRGLGELPAAERPAAGQAANTVKAQLEAELVARVGAEGHRGGRGAGARASRRNAAGPPARA